MKLLLTDYEDYSEVIVQSDSGINEHVFAFDDHKQARAFCSGFQCAKKVINGLVQSLPVDYIARKVPLKGMDSLSQQLAHKQVEA
jgi:hypothetical protein